MKISPLELMITPHDIILADLEMMEFEYEYQPREQTPQQDNQNPQEIPHA